MEAQKMCLYDKHQQCQNNQLEKNIRRERQERQSLKRIDYKPLQQHHRPGSHHQCLQQRMILHLAILGRDSTNLTAQMTKVSLIAIFVPSLPTSTLQKFPNRPSLMNCRVFCQPWTPIADQQVQQKQMRRQEAMKEDARYHQNSLIELERWKANEQAREQERQAQNIKETKDRDEQLAFERKLKAEEMQRKKEEESSLVEKIVTEMESEQRRFERKKEQTKKAMKKVFEENMEDQRKRQQAKKEQMNKEAAAMKEYNRVLDEQEEQRAQELGDRLERQNQLMQKLQENVAAVQKGAGDNDAQRANAQQEEMDRHFFEAESLKQARLKQLRLENQAYLLKQMEEKDGRGEEDKELQNIQAMILRRDTQEYNEIEKQKIVDRRIRNLEHRKDIEKQMEYKMRQSQPEMSEAEIQMNKPLLHLVNRTLDERDKQMYDCIPEGNEDDC